MTAQRSFVSIWAETSIGLAIGTIEPLEASNQSAMPTDLIKHLSKKELRDLVE